MKARNPLRSFMQQLRIGTDSRRKKLTADEWPAFRKEAAQWLADLDEKYDRLAAETWENVEQIREEQSKHRARSGVRRLWLPLATGLAVFVAIVVATRSR
jgi:hypothetical protein